MEIKRATIIRAPEITAPRDWRDDMIRIPRAKQARFHTHRWYSRDGEDGVLDYKLAPWHPDSEQMRVGNKVADPTAKTALYFVAGAGAKAEGLRAQCDYFYIDDRLYQRLTWIDVEEPVQMQRVNSYVDMGDTSGKWEKYGRQTARTHLEKNEGHALHVRRGDKVVAAWRNGHMFHVAHLPLEDPNDAESESFIYMKRAERAVGYVAKERGLSVQRNKRLIYFVVEVKVTETVKENIAEAMREL